MDIQMDTSSFEKMRHTPEEMARLALKQDSADQPSLYPHGGPTGKIQVGDWNKALDIAIGLERAGMLKAEDGKDRMMVVIVIGSIIAGNPTPQDYGVGVAALSVENRAER